MVRACFSHSTVENIGLIVVSLLFLALFVLLVWQASKSNILYVFHVINYVLTLAMTAMMQVFCVGSFTFHGSFWSFLALGFIVWLVLTLLCAGVLWLLGVKSRLKTGN